MPNSIAWLQNKGGPYSQTGFHSFPQRFRLLFSHTEGRTWRSRKEAHHSRKWNGAWLGGPPWNVQAWKRAVNCRPLWKFLRNYVSTIEWNSCVENKTKQKNPHRRMTHTEWTLDSWRWISARGRLEPVPSIRLEGKPQGSYSWEAKLASCSIFMTFAVAVNALQQDLIGTQTPERKEGI